MWCIRRRLILWLLLFYYIGTWCTLTFRRWLFFIFLLFSMSFYRLRFIVLFPNLSLQVLWNFALWFSNYVPRAAPPFNCLRLKEQEVNSMIQTSVCVHQGHYRLWQDHSIMLLMSFVVSHAFQFDKWSTFPSRLLVFHGLFDELEYW